MVPSEMFNSVGRSGAIVQKTVAVLSILGEVCSLFVAPVSLAVWFCAD